MPTDCLSAASVEDFFKTLEKYDSQFNKVYQDAVAQDRVLRFIAKMENGKASAGLEGVNNKSPFYSLDGTDNMISFTTDRYHDRPLVIKGPGAGAEVTAAGVFAEIISISHYLG